METRKSADGAARSDEPVVHLRMSELDAKFHAAFSLALADCITATGMTEAGTLPNQLQRVRWRRNNAFVVLLAVRAVDRLYDLAGMRALSADSHVAHSWRDVHAVASQVSVSWKAQAANYGRTRFGLPLGDPRI